MADEAVAHWTSGVQRLLERANRINRVTAAKYISFTVLNLFFYSERVAENSTSSPPRDKSTTIAVTMVVISLLNRVIMI